MNWKKHLSLACMALAVGLTVGSAGAASITIVNANFEAVLVDNWYWVPDWDEGGDSFYGNSSGSGGHLVYLDGGDPGWISQNLSYNWTAGDVFTLGIKGNQGYRSGGAFKIKLRQADGTVLWDSGTISVNSTWQNFSWSIDASTFSGAGVVPGSQLNIRIEDLANTVYLDDVTLSTSLAGTTAPTLVSIVDNKSGGPIAPNTLVTYTVTFNKDMDASTVDATDFGNAGSATISFGTVTETTPGVFTVPVTTTGAGTLQLKVNAGAVLNSADGIALDTTSALPDDTTITVDATAPTLAGSGIVDDKSGGPVERNTLVTYTVTFSKDMDASTVSAASFGNAGSASVTIGTVTETTPTSGVFSVPVTPATTGSLILKVNAGAVLKDVAGNALDTTSALPDDTTITVNDTIPPTLVSIVDNKSGGPVERNTLVSYTVTFSEAMDAGTVGASDFGNAGGAAVTIGTVSQISPAVFSVQATPTSGGLLRLQVNQNAGLTDLAGIALNTTSAIPDDTTITVDATPITILNANFEDPLFDEDGAGGSAASYWVPDWDEGGDSFYGSGYVYLDAGNPGWISQNLSYNWTATEVFTLGIKGKQGWQSGGPYRFKIQLREADGTVLWDSGTVSVNSTWQNFSWSIDASMFSGAGVAPGSQLNIRIECLGTSSVYLDDVTLWTAVIPPRGTLISFF
jgi:hypothetical protein